LIERSAGCFELRFHFGKLVANLVGLRCDCFSLGEGFCLQRSELLLALCEGGGFADTLLSFGLGGCALLLNGHDSALEISVQTIYALDGSLGTATTLFEAG